MKLQAKEWIVQLGLRRYLNLLILAVVVYYLLYEIVPNWSQLKQYNYHQDPVYGLLSFSCLLVYFAVMAWLWKIILSSYEQKISLPHAFRIISLSQMAKYIPGGFWPLMGQVHLGRGIGISKAMLLRSTLLHLLFTLVTGLEIFLFWRSTLEVGETRWAFLVLLIVVVVFSVTPYCLDELFDGLLKFFWRKDLLDPLPRWTFVKTIGFQLVFICCWLWLGLALWLFINSLAPLPARLYLDALGAFAISWGLGVLNFMAPAGIGTREAGFHFFLKDLLPSSEALIVVLAARVWTTLAELTCAAVAWRLDG